MDTTHQESRDWIDSVLGLVFLLLAVGLLGWNWKWYLDVSCGPITLDETDLSQIKDPGTLSNQFVTLPITRKVDTDIRRASRRYGFQDVVSDFAMLQIADKWLIVELPAGFKGDQLTGYLSRWGSDKNNEAVRAIYQKAPQAYRDHLLPFQLDASRDHVTESRLGLFVIAGCATMGLYWLSSGLRKREVEPETETETEAFGLHTTSWYNAR